MAKTQGQTEKHYIGGFAKEYQFDDGSALINLELDLADLQSCAVDDKGRIRIVVKRRRTPDAAGNTHYVEENKPKPKSAAGGGARTGGGFSKQAQRPQAPARRNTGQTDDLPF